MNTKLTGGKRSAEHVVKDIRRATRRHFSSEDKIRIVLDCLRGEDSIAELCRKAALPRACTTPGRRNSWKKASGGWRVIRHALRRRGRRWTVPRQMPL
jgi:transposase